MTVTDLVTKHTTDECTEDGATRDGARQRTGAIGMLVHAGFIPARALQVVTRTGGQRLHVDDARVVVRTIAVIVTTLVLFVATLIVVALIAGTLIALALGECATNS
jgi:hypothetical protein